MLSFETGLQDHYEGIFGKTNGQNKFCSVGMLAWFTGFKYVDIQCSVLLTYSHPSTCQHKPGGLIRKREGKKKNQSPAAEPLHWGWKWRPYLWLGALHRETEVRFLTNRSGQFHPGRTRSLRRAPKMFLTSLEHALSTGRDDVKSRGLGGRSVLCGFKCGPWTEVHIWGM